MHRPLLYPLAPFPSPNRRGEGGGGWGEVLGHVCSVTLGGVPLETRPAGGGTHGLRCTDLSS
ncbi:MAG: hypothetical protein ACUVXG_04905, partial [Anaerolineae bacterium]